ncbi:MAG TPA: alpha/beta fold hydrolase [Candidatus Baltobacteraceae bacterium]|nr:alpha/beta fold hydrolase [Candidatus Baltobacteraceae bacterium]
MIETMRVEAPEGAVTGARVSGARGAALIFVHGVGSTAAIWDTQLDAFSADFRCAAVELRGNGALENPDPALITREGFASDVLAVADALGFETFTLVGCSLGGIVAFELWKCVPQRFDSMVIVGSFARYPDGDNYARTICEGLAGATEMRAFAESRAARLGLPPERYRETVEQMGRKSVACYCASTQATWTGDYRDVLSTIAVPALVLCGERDAIAPAALSEEIVAGIPGAQFAVVENAGHVANADAPERFNELVREFLSVAVP